MSESKQLKEWARKWMPKVRYGPPDPDNMRREMERAGRELARQCAEIAGHFANDKLTPEEYPKYGLVRREDRCDSGRSSDMAEKIEWAILRAFGMDKEGEK